MTKHPFVSIIIPTFNRAHTLPRALASIAEQTDRDFEVIVVDDGSSDDTETLIHSWQSEQRFPLHYLKQANQGKHIAHNTGVEAARGELGFILDSDDWLPNNAIALIRHHWEAIPETDRAGFAGIEGHCAFSDGSIEGGPFPTDVLDTDFISLRRHYRVGGDKKAAVRTDILRALPYPQFEGERHIRPSLLWKEIALRYRMRYVNAVLQFKELQPGGLSSNRFRLRRQNPRGFRHYYLQDVNRFQKDAAFRERLDSMVKYIRYGLHAGDSLTASRAAVNAPMLWWLALPGAWLKFHRDRRRLEQSDD